MNYFCMYCWVGSLCNDTYMNQGCQGTFKVQKPLQEEDSKDKVVEIIYNACDHVKW